MNQSFKTITIFSPQSGHSNKDGITFSRTYNNRKYSATTKIDYNNRTVSIVGKVKEKKIKLPDSKYSKFIIPIITILLIITEILLMPITLHLLVAIVASSIAILGSFYLKEKEPSFLKFHGAEHIIGTKVKSRKSLMNYYSFQNESTISNNCSSCVLSSIIICEVITIVLFQLANVYLSFFMVIPIALLVSSYPVFDFIGLLLQKYLLTDKPDEIHLQVAMLSYLYLQENINNNLNKEIVISFKDMNSKINYLLSKYN